MATVNDVPQVTKAGGPAEQYAALRQVAMAVVRGAAPEAVFALAAERIALLVGADGSGIVRFAGDRGSLVGHWARRGLVEREVPRDVPLTGRSSVAQVFQTGRPARVDDYGTLDDVRGRALAEIYTSGVAVPIRLGPALWGAIGVGARRPNLLGPEVERVLSDFAELVALTVAGAEPAARAANDALLDVLLSTAPIGIAFLDPDLRVIRASPAFALWSGSDPQHLVGADVTTERAPFPQLDVQAIGRVRSTGIAEDGVIVERSGEGADRHDWLMSCSPIVGPSDELEGLGIVVIDVTEQRRDAEALRRERDYTAALIGAMTDGILVLAPNGTITDASARLCEMLGVARDRLVGAVPPHAFWGGGEDAERAAVAFDRVLRGDGGDFELRFMRSDGRLLPVHVTHAAMAGEDGGVRGYVVTVRDVTERYRAEEERASLFAAERAARNRTEILQQVSAALAKALTPEQVVETIISGAVPLVGAVGGTVLLDADGVLHPVIRQDRRLRLVSAPRALVPSGDSVIHRVARSGVGAFMGDREDLRREDPVLEAAVRADVAAVGVVPIGQPGRVQGALAFGFPHARTFDAEDRALLVTLGDVCAQALDRARLYDATRARADALRQRDALRQAVLRGVSHEFRTPLTAIANAADALERVGDADLRRELLDVIGSETRRLDRFVANVLDLSRLEGGVLKPHLDSCSPTELVAGALEAVDALVGDVAVAVDVAAELPFVRADPVLTERILLNLIHNAARHGGPTITLRVRHVEGRIWFVVADDGPGVPRGMRRTIFEPFVGQAERGGLGLGLGLSKGLAVAQGGDLWLESARSDTRFVVALPVDRPGER